MKNDQVDRGEASKTARRLRRVRQIFTIAVLVTAAEALLALVAWFLGIEKLTSLHPDWVTIKTNTAVSFLLASSSLWLLGPHARPPPTRLILARVLATALVVLGALSLFQDIFGWNLGIDELLVAERVLSPATVSPNRMAPITALSFALIGTAILLRTGMTPMARGLSQATAITVAALSYLVIVDYLYGVSFAFMLSRATAMALPTAFGLVLLSVATVCTQPHQGIVGAVVSERLGGHVARRLLPAAVLIPPLLGLLRLAGETAGLYETKFGLAVHVVTTVLLFAGMTWWSAAVLDRLDRRRVDAMNKKAAESKGRELERRRLRAVLDVLPVGVVFADASGQIMDLNRAIKTIWGMGAPLVDSMTKYGEYRAWSPLTRQRVKAEEWGLYRSIRDGEVCIAEEVEIEPFDESARKTILNYSSPIRDEHGVIAGGVAVNVDITDRKREELELLALRDELEQRVQRRTAELAAANAELEAFSYSVSHDLRAPLRWVDGFTQALVEDCADKLDDTGREYIRQIRESVQRMSELIDALLRLSRITRVPLERTEVDLGQLARNVASELDASDLQRRVNWEIADDMRVTGDPKLILVVMENLLRNAWKFTRTRDMARIQVGVMLQGDEQVFFVRDNGVGFDMTYADKLFRSFERLHRADEFEGTGVGLALVKRVIQRHGGRVWAEGCPNEGATFYFTLGAPRESP